MDISLAVENLDWLAVAVATVASMVWGFLWYSQSVAGKAWAKASGLSAKDLQKTDPSAMIIMLLTTFIKAFTVAVVLVAVDGVVDGLVDGAFLGVGFVGVTLVAQGAFAKQMEAAKINAAFEIANFAIIGGVLGLFS